LQIGYAVVRALADYRFASRFRQNLPEERDLKVSLATESGPSTTFHVASSHKSKSGFRQEIVLSPEEVPILPRCVFLLPSTYFCPSPHR
jgi:hypothetical protein